MPSLTETLILHGALPIEQLSVIPRSRDDEQQIIDDLRDRGILSSLQIARARAAMTNTEFVELSSSEIDSTAIARLPAALCRRHDVIPIGTRGTSLVVAMADPTDVLARDDVRLCAEGPIHVVAAERGDVVRAIDRYHRADDELNSLSSSFDAGQAVAVSAIDLVEVNENDAPIVRFVNLLVSQAIQDQASDIHIEPTEGDIRIRYRIDGVLHEMQPAPKTIQSGLISRLKVMAEIDISERRKPQDGRMSVRHAGRGIDLRVATLPTVWGEKLVMRILDNGNRSMNLRDLNMLDRNLDVFAECYTKPYGMILVTGPTGSGKSTTLYTTLSELVSTETNIITVEDPVEYRMPGVNQVQVNTKAGLTFSTSLRSILRSDPDVVLIGEIRDQETAQIAIEASLTGHMVLSTLHTNDAPGAITRLTEMGVEPYLVGSAIDCVVAQRLARRLCERCKVPGSIRRDQLEKLRFALPDDGTEPQLFRAVGCQACSNTGFRGRIALHEVMAISEDIERLAGTHAPAAEIARVAASQGMSTLREDGWAKAQMGLTTVDEILRVVA